MATVKISALPAATAPFALTDLAVAVKGGTTSKVGIHTLGDLGGTTATVAISAGGLDLSAVVAGTVRVTLDANVTSITLPSGLAGTRRDLLVEFTQDATGGRTVSGWPSVAVENGGTMPTLNSAANSITVYRLSRVETGGWRMASAPGSGGGASTATQSASSSGGVLNLSATTAPVILVTLTENITSVTLPAGASGQTVERRIVFTQAAGNYTIPTAAAAWGGISVDGAGTIPPMGTGAGTVSMYKLTNDDNTGWRMYVDQTGGGGGSTSSPVSVISGTTYTGAASDNGKTLVFTNTAAKAATIDPQATTPLPNDWELILNNKGTSNLTVVAGSGVTISPPAGGTLVIPSGGTCALKRRGADDFFLAGNTL